jgi:hypothetical protein
MSPLSIRQSDCRGVCAAPSAHKRTHDLHRKWPARNLDLRGSNGRRSGGPQHLVRRERCRGVPLSFLEVRMGTSELLQGTGVLRIFRKQPSGLFRSVPETYGISRSRLPPPGPRRASASSRQAGSRPCRSRRSAGRGSPARSARPSGTPPQWAALATVRPPFPSTGPRGISSAPEMWPSGPWNSAGSRTSRICTALALAATQSGAISGTPAAEYDSGGHVDVMRWAPRSRGRTADLREAPRRSSWDTEG